MRRKKEAEAGNLQREIRSGLNYSASLFRTCRFTFISAAAAVCSPGPGLEVERLLGAPHRHQVA